MIENAESTGSTILGLNYTHNLSEKMDLVGSFGYGMGFGVLPMKVDLKYGITDKISANLGMGMYMISDSTYDANAIGVDGEDASTNEFGLNLGLGYQVTDAITLGFNYNMVKSGDYDFNGMSFGLSYGFGGNSTDESKKVVKKATKPKKEPKPTKSKKEKK
jgi:opacity protein-like surface antigen